MRNMEEVLLLDKMVPQNPIISKFKRDPNITCWYICFSFLGFAITFSNIIYSPQIFLLYFCQEITLFVHRINLERHKKETIRWELGFSTTISKITTSAPFPALLHTHNRGPGPPNILLPVFKIPIHPGFSGTTLFQSSLFSLYIKPLLNRIPLLHTLNIFIKAKKKQDILHPISSFMFHLISLLCLTAKPLQEFSALLSLFCHLDTFQFCLVP